MPTLKLQTVQRTRRSLSSSSLIHQVQPPTHSLTLSSHLSLSLSLSRDDYDCPQRSSSTNVETVFEQQQMKAAVSRGNARLRMRHIKIRHCSSPMQGQRWESELGGWVEKGIQGVRRIIV